jgi:arabinogalactan oligomer/maltooligosaccharide transport system substrate-binding protein
MKSFFRTVFMIICALALTLAAACGGNGGGGGQAAETAGEGAAQSGAGMPQSRDNADNPATATAAAAGAEQIRLKVWAPVEEQLLTISMCEAFRDSHPELDITFEYAVMGLDRGGSIDSLKRDPDVAADVFMFPTGGIPELVEAGLLYPITVNADAIRAEHTETSIQSCTFNGLLYAVPVTPNSWFMYYDKSKFTEDEVKSLEAMMAKDLGEGVYNFSCQISNGWYISAFFYAAGAELFGPNGTDPESCTWNRPNGVAAGNYLIDLVKNPRYVEDRDGIAGTLMREGKLAALCSGVWSAASLKESLGENYAAAKLPTVNINGADVQLSNFADFKAFGVKSSTKHPRAAQMLAAWLSNEANQLQRFEKPGTVAAPTQVSLLNHPAILQNQEIAALGEQTRHSTPNPATSKLSDYWTPAEALGTGIFNGDVTKANLQENLDAFVNAVLASFGR